MWKTFIDHGQSSGIGLFLSPLWDTSNTLSLFTDASGSLGYGGIFQKRSFQGKWLPSQQLGQQGISILWQKLYSVNVAYHLFGPLWTCPWGSQQYCRLSFSIPDGALPSACTPSQHNTRPYPSLSV